MRLVVVSDRFVASLDFCSETQQSLKVDVCLSKAISFYQEPWQKCCHFIAKSVLVQGKDIKVDLVALIQFSDCLLRQS